MKLMTRPTLILALAALLLPVGRLAAQSAIPPELQALLAQPGAADLIRAKLQQSGLTPDQIRTRLQASGYSGSLLDSYLSAATPGSASSVSIDEVKAMAALGLTPPTAATAATSGDTAHPVVPVEPPSGVFGVDVFRRSTTQFQPMVSGPVPPDYRLGPGDQLVLILTGEVETTQQLSVTREGFVLIPQVGQVFLSNLTLEQAKNVLYDRLGRVYSGVRRGAGARTQFELSVANVRAVQVYVIGEVTTPGAYQLSALATTTGALYTAGGVTEHANLRKIVVRRAGKEVASFDLYDYLLRGDVSKDIRLENGDVVFVGVRERRVNVAGNVRRPAAYDVAPTETLADLVTNAGGLQADAALSHISISRIIPASQRVAGAPDRMRLDVTPASGVVPALPLEDADVVTIYGVADAERNEVEVAGSVYLPGKFGFEPGMKLSALVARAGGLLPGTYAGRAQIARLVAETQTRRMVGVVLPADSAAPWTSDVVLEDHDIITIFSRLTMRPERTVTIVGAVNEPKTVPYREGMTVRDLVLLANGLAPGASLDSAEVARLPVDRRPGQLAQTIRFALDSTYIFDHDTLGRPLLPPGGKFRASGAPEIPLQPWDNVLILAQPDFQYHETVVITGEVKFPGSYSLQRRDERLSDLITRAGGLTGRAYAEGVRFERATDAVGRIDIDLPDALRHPTSRSNLVLQNGDKVEVPVYEPSVRVQGAVNSPGSVLWQRGRSLGDYVSSAGGLANNADGSRASVRQANGEIQTRHGGFLFFGHREPTPGPGSVVTVPVEKEEIYHDRSGMFAAIASMIASTATIFIVLSRK